MNLSERYNSEKVVFISELKYGDRVRIVERLQHTSPNADHQAGDIVIITKIFKCDAHTRCIGCTSNLHFAYLEKKLFSGDIDYSCYYRLETLDGRRIL